MKRSTIVSLVAAVAAAVVGGVWAAPAAAEDLFLERHVRRLADEERRERGDRAAAEYIERWAEAFAARRPFEEVALGAEARRANPDLVDRYEDLAERLRRAEYWEAKDLGAPKHPLAAANLALARFHIAKGEAAPRRRISDLFAQAIPHICRLDFPPVPPAEPPAPPRASISVDPAEIRCGEEATVSWSTENATAATLDGRPVVLVGSRQVRPCEDQEYVLVARGPGGEATDRARLRVLPRPAPVSYRIHFDFDKALIRPDAEDTLAAVAAAMLRNPAMRLRVEGHTDAIGTEAYNQGLSERRAQAAFEYLVERFGIDAGRFALEGHSERRPIAPNAQPDGTDDPAGRALNRRVEFHEIR